MKKDRYDQREVYQLFKMIGEGNSFVLKKNFKIMSYRFRKGWIGRRPSWWFVIRSVEAHDYKVVRENNLHTSFYYTVMPFGSENYKKWRKVLIFKDYNDKVIKVKHFWIHFHRFYKHFKRYANKNIHHVPSKLKYHKRYE